MKSSKIAVEKQRNTFLPQIRDEVKNSLKIFKKWIEAEPLLEWVEPDAGVVAIVRLKNARSSNS